MRLQAAMKDLLWAHQGRIDTLPSAVEDCFPNPDRRPREIIGITIVRKESGRLYSNDPSFLPIAVRLDVATGRCDLRFAYETQSGGYTSSRWEQLSDALAQIARLSPVKFAEDPRERKTRFMRFVGEVISESVDDGAQPVVLVDSSNVVNLWPWLADKSITTDEISIGEKQWMQTVWAEARIIRIRHGLAPYLVEDKRRHWPKHGWKTRGLRTKSSLIVLSGCLRLLEADCSEFSQALTPGVSPICRWDRKRSTSRNEA